MNAKDMMYEIGLAAITVAATEKRPDAEANLLRFLTRNDGTLDMEMWFATVSAVVENNAFLLGSIFAGAVTKEYYSENANTQGDL